MHKRPTVDAYAFWLAQPLDARVQSAAELWLRRNHPHLARSYHWAREGVGPSPETLHGVMDNRGRWWPTPDEAEPCCRGIYPGAVAKTRYALLAHCRSAKHVATKLRVPERAVRRMARTIRVLTVLAKGGNSGATDL